MQTLLDTNILLRSIQPASPDRAAALSAVTALLKSGRTLGISSQTIYEFLAVATRPVADNGLGLNHAAADKELETLLAGIEILFDSLAVATETRRLVVAHQVIGKKTHDARLVAIMNVHGVKEILTFNHTDFSRYPGISILRPAGVALANLPDYPPQSAN